MPCSQPARGTKAGAIPPFNDTTDSNPCGRKTVTTAGGVDVSAHTLCLPHLLMKLGYASVKSPIVMEP